MLIDCEKMCINPYYIVAIKKIDDFKQAGANYPPYALRYDTLVTNQEYIECFTLKSTRDEVYKKRMEQIKKFFEVYK